jgi:hypothetical protein
LTKATTKHASKRPHRAGSVKHLSQYLVDPSLCADFARIVLDSQVGHAYTRQAIYTILGGDVVSTFPTQKGRVVCCCVSQYSHPDAPQVILVARSEGLVASAQQLASQREAVPIFVRQSRNRRDAFIYQGAFVVERYSENHDDIKPFANRA